MSKRKKIVALLVGFVILMSLGVIAGCANDEGNLPNGGDETPIDASHKITYMLDGGVKADGAYATEFRESEAVSFSSYEPTKEKHTFAGWYLDSKYTQKTTGIDVGTKTDIVVYAHFIYGTKGLAYTLNTENTGYLVSAGNTELEENIGVPATYLDLPVVGIQDGGFARAGSMKTIELPNGLKTIGNESFMQCYMLKNITLPTNLESIGESAFGSCSSLIEIEIPRNVKILSNFVFSYCDMLKKVTFQAGSQCQSFEPNSFLSCSSLEKIVIPASVTKIKTSSFSGCVALNSALFEKESRCVEIGQYAFSGCDSLVTIIIPNGVTMLDSAFTDCIKLTSVTLPSNLKETSRTFERCNELGSVLIPESLINIGESTFSDCKNLKTVGISSKTVSIAADAFKNCVSLLSISLPSTVTNIAPTAFKNCGSLESIVVDPNNATYRSESNCLIEKLSEKLVKGCKNSTIPETIKAIGEYAFLGCSALTSLQIPSSVEKISSDAFAYCSGLVRIEVSAQNKIYKSEGNCLFEQSFNTVIVGCNTSILPTTIRSIDDYAFSGRTFSSLNIPDSVRSIGSFAFADCVNLTKVVIPNGVTRLFRSIFSGCTKLQSVVIPISVTTIDVWNFSDCPNLTIRVRVTEDKKPIGWVSQWSCDRPVIWGYTE